MRLKAAGLAGLFWAVFSPAVDAAAESKNYSFPEVKIEIRVDRDGTFSVDESRTYDFQGRFSWASLWIPTRVERLGRSYEATIEDFTIRDERGEAFKTEIRGDRDRLEAKWFYVARNERRTFRIHYRVRGAILSHPDATELYWQAIGSGWDKPTKTAAVTVRLPEPVRSREDMLVYGHGPLSGFAEIVDTQTTRFTASNLGPRQFLEIRMVWPPGMVRGVPSNLSSRESIRQEEARYVEETLVRIRKTRDDTARRAKTFKWIMGLWLLSLFGAPLVWFPIFQRSWKKSGRDYRFSGIPEYVREPAYNLPPALVELLMKEGVGITPKAFTATIFDLARRGYLEFEDRLEEKRGIFFPKQDYKTTITLKKDYRAAGELLAFETAVMNLVFVDIAGHQGGEHGRLTLGDLKTYLRSHPRQFQTWYRAWTKSVQAEGKRLGFIEPESLRARNVAMAVTIPLAVITLNPLLAVLSGVLIPTLKRRAMAWARENEQWQGLRRFLDDFSNFEDIPPEAYKLWERYLVFGILFGNAKKILKTLPVVLQDDRAVVPVWYQNFHQSGFLTSGGLEHMVASLTTMSTAIQSAANYSSGSGGGFSGGGGGGAGGGGRRSRMRIQSEEGLLKTFVIALSASPKGAGTLGRNFRISLCWERSEFPGG